MRFCPFCSAENLDEAGECASCARRLPPQPPRRRKNGLERTAPVAAAVPSVAESGAERSGALGPKKKGLAELAPSPAAGRREPSQPAAAPAGIIERRKATASPSSTGGRRRTMPPVPSRTERDLRASLSTGVAPGLASESIALPDLSSRQKSAESGAVVTTAGPVAEAASMPTPAPATTTPTRTPGESGEWPAPATSAAAHPDDWTLESEDSDSALSSATHRTASLNKDRAVTATGPTELVSAISKPPTPESVTEERSHPTLWPPPTRTTLVNEPFKVPEVMPIPSVPEAGLFRALSYTIAFERAKWQRVGAIKTLREQMRKDTGMLDGILGALGKQARSLGIESKPLESENRAIQEAENRRKTADHECSELSNRQAEENSKFADAEAERQAKVTDADKSLEAAESELGGLEAQRKSLRDKRKSIETRKKAYLKSAESRELDGSKQEDSEMRLEMRQGAQSLRSDAAELDKERQDIDRRVAALEKPITQLSSRVGALKSDLDAAKRALTNLREGHRHRLAEIEAEQGRKSRELAQAEAEIQRREVTLGTLVNLNRIERGEFADLYEQIDSLRGRIGALSNQIDKLSAEREAFDKASRVRGAIVLAGLVVLILAFLAIIMSIT